MNTLTFPLSVALETPARRSVTADPYASEAQTTALLRSGAAYRRERIQAADMITTDEAAELAGATRVTINAWIKAGRCVGVAHLRRGYKLPRWQFEPGPGGSGEMRLSGTLNVRLGGKNMTFYQRVTARAAGACPAEVAR